MYVASTVTWDRDNLPDSVRIQPEDDNRVDWLKSSLYALMMSADLVARYQMESPGPWERFAFLRDLQQHGVTDHVAQLVLFGATERANAPG
jgi:hypothetical protein